MRYQDDINTEHNMKSIGRAAVAQWTKRLTRNGQTPVRIREAHIFDITKPLLIGAFILRKSTFIFSKSHDYLGNLVLKAI